MSFEVFAKHNLCPQTFVTKVLLRGAPDRIEVVLIPLGRLRTETSFTTPRADSIATSICAIRPRGNHCESDSENWKHCDLRFGALKMMGYIQKWLPKWALQKSESSKTGPWKGRSHRTKVCSAAWGQFSTILCLSLDAQHKLLAMLRAGGVRSTTTSCNASFAQPPPLSTFLKE